MQRARRRLTPVRRMAALAPLAAAVAWWAAASARAAVVTFGAPTTLTGNADVSVAGSPAFAYDWSTTQTVNGVTFKATTVTAGNVGTDLTLAGFGTRNATAYTSTVNPFNGFPAAYKAVLIGSVYGGGTGTVTLNGLTAGHQYQVQVWVNDPRAGATTNRTQNITGGGGNTQLLKFNTNRANGSPGQYTLGAFTANAASQAFTLAPVSGTVEQLNAIQVRDVTGSWSGEADGNWDEATVNFSGMSFAAAKALRNTVYFGDKNARGQAVSNATVTVQAGGSTGAHAVFQNQAVDYTLDSADTNGLRGAFSLTKTGTGTLTLRGPQTYTGLTAIGAGTVTLNGGDNRLPVGTTVAFSGASTLNLGAVSQTIAAATVPDTASASTTVTIGGAAGTLLVNGATDLQWGPGGPGQTLSGTPLTTVNLAGLGHFTYSAPARMLRVGLKAGSGNNGGVGQVALVTLARTNNLTAATLAVGDIGSNSDGGISTLHLGRSNNLRVNTLNVGASGRSDATLDFAAGLTAPTVTLRNTDGASAVANWLVGRVAQFKADTFGATVNLSAGTLDARVTTLTIGNAETGGAVGRAGTENGVFTMGAGMLDATTLTIGRIAGAGGLGAAYAGNGTFTLNHADGTVRAVTLNLAENMLTATGAVTKTTSGTFNLDAGTLRAATLQKGAQTGNATATATFNWNNGALRNYGAGTNLVVGAGLTLKLAATGTHSFDIDADCTATVNGVLAGAGGTLTKAGAGTLSLPGANTFTGGLSLDAGTLSMGNAGAVGPSGSLAMNGGVLLWNGSATDLSGRILLKDGRTAVFDTGGGQVTFASPLQVEAAAGGALTKAGAGTLTLAAANTYTGLTTVAAGRLDVEGAVAAPIAVKAGAVFGGEGTTTGRLDCADGALLAVRSATPGAFQANGVGFTGTVQVVLDDPSASNRFAVVGYGAGGLAGLASLVALDMRAGVFADDPTNRQVTLSVTTGARTWAGVAGTAWDVGVSTNWQEGDRLFYAGDAVTFDDSATGGATVNLASAVRPASVTVSNSMAAYTLTGPGALAGMAALVKRGDGSLTVASSNTYTGGTTLLAGRLRLGAAAALGTGRLTLGGGALSSDGVAARALSLPVTLGGACMLGDAVDSGAITLSGGIALAAPATLTVPTVQGIMHVLSGSVDDGGAAYSLTKEGASGILVLSAANTYAGGTVIKAGRINAGNAAAFGTGPVDVSPTGQAYLTVAGPFTNTFRIAGTGYTEVAGQLGAIRLQGSTSSGPLTLTGNARIGAYSSAGSLLGPIGETGGACALELGGTATGAHSGNPITVGGTAPNTYSGGATVVNAIVVAGKSSAFGSGPVTLRAPNFNARIQLANGVHVTNALAIAGSPCVGVVGRGLLEVTGTAQATWSGPIAITAAPSGGGHLYTDAGATLTLTGPITAPAGFSQRAGSVVYAGGGACTNVALTGTARLGAPNGMVTNAVLILGASGACTFDLKGFDQALGGLTKGGSAALVGSSSTTADSTLTLRGTSRFAGVIQDKVGAGTRKVALVVDGGQLTLAGTNTYTGVTTIRSGTLRLGVAGALQARHAVTLAGGTLAAGTVANTLGALTLEAGSTLTVEAGGALAFAASDAAAWSGALAVQGALTATTLRFGTDRTGLTARQVSAIRLNGASAVIDDNGYIVAQPGTLLIIR